MGSLGNRWSYASLAAQTALTFNSHISLQVYRKLVSLFTTFPLPAEVPTFSVMRCLQPTRIAVERANGYHVLAQRRRIGGRAMELVSGHESFLTRSNRGALSILDARFKFARASHLVSGEPWSTVRNKEHLEEFYVFSAVMGVFAGLMSASVWMHRKRASRSRFVKDVASWILRGRVSERIGSRCRSRAVRSIASDVFFECISSDEDEVSLSRRESRADFPAVLLQLLDPSEWTLAACGGFTRDENITGLAARSILYAVRHAESGFPPGRLPIFLTMLRWCWRSALDARKLSHCFLTCVQSLRLVSGQDLSCRSGGYRQS